jgi:predicted NUDIX family NTP pyrophosphohydrolase
MPKLSAGILLYKKTSGKLEVFLVHPGGPFWAKKDEGSWSVPKGEYLEGDDAWQAAQREFREETGFEAPAGELIELGEVKYNNKLLVVWAMEGSVDARRVKSNTFTMEWPPKTGRKQDFPEVDRAGWFMPAYATRKLVKGQVELIDRLLLKLGISDDEATSETQLSLL